MAEITLFSALVGMQLVKAARNLRFDPVKSYVKIAKLAPIVAGTAPEHGKIALDCVNEAEVAVAMTVGKNPCEHQELARKIIHQMRRNLKPIEDFLEKIPTPAPHEPLRTPSTELLL